MAKIIFNEFFGGFAPQHYNQNPEFRTVGQRGSYAEGLCNPFMELGILSPAVTELTDLDNSSELGAGKIIQKMILSDEAQNAPIAYGIEDGSNLHKITLSGINQHDIDSPNFHDIALGGAHAAHSTIVGKDMTLYQRNGVTKIFYAWSDGTDGDVGIIDQDGTGSDDDFMTTTPTDATATAFADSSYDTILEVADNNFMYMFNRQNVHKFDGTLAAGANGAFTSAVLTLRDDWKIVDALDARGKMWIAAIRTEQGTTFGIHSREVAVHVWDRISTTVSIEDVIPVPGASQIYNIFMHDGTLHCFTSSTSTDTTGRNAILELRRYDGRQFSVVENVGTNNQPHRNGVLSMRGAVVWLGKDGGTYAYGKFDPTLPPALVQLNDITIFNTQGALFKGNGDNIYLSYAESGSTSKLQRWLPNEETGDTSDSTWRSLAKQLPKLSRITGVTVLWPPFTSTTDKNLAIKLYKNMNSSAESLTMDINYNTSSDIGWKYFPMSIENVNSIQIGLEWPTATGLDVSASVRPYRIEVDYEPTGKLK